MQEIKEIKYHEDALSAYQSGAHRMASGWLKRIFQPAASMVIGFSVMGSAKALAGITAGAMGWQAAAVAAGTAGAVGAASFGLNYVRDYWDERRKAKENGAGMPEFCSAARAKKAGIKALFNMAASVAGAAAFAGLDELAQRYLPEKFVETALEKTGTFMAGLVNDALSAAHEWGLIGSAMADELPLDPLQRLVALSAHNGALSEAARVRLDLAASGDSQAIKDLGYFIYNGREGFSADPETALSLYEKAAAAGNRQAPADLAYIKARMPSMSVIDTAPDMPDTPPPAAQQQPAPVLETPARAGVLDALEGQALGAKAEKLLELARAGDMQALGDAGLGLLNGQHGFPKLPEQGVALLREAAQSGNVNARINFAYLQYHGLYGVGADRNAALATIGQIGKAWSGGESLLADAGKIAAETAGENAQMDFLKQLGPPRSAQAAVCDIAKSMSWDGAPSYHASCNIEDEVISAGQELVFNMSAPGTAEPAQKYVFTMGETFIPENTEALISGIMPKILRF